MLGIILAFGFVAYFLYYHYYLKRKDFPPGPTPLPILGNTPQLIKNHEPHIQLDIWSKKYGPIFTIWVGNEPKVIITDYYLIKDTLVKQAEVFAGRPEHFINKNVIRKGTDFGVLFNDGPVWKRQRRFALHTLKDFGFGQSVMEDKVKLEVEKLFHNIETLTENNSLNDEGIDMWPALGLTVANIISSLLMGKTMDGEGRFEGLCTQLGNIFKMLISPTGQLLSLYPFLRYIPLFGHFGYNQACALRDSFFSYINEDLEEHKANFNPEDEPTDYTAAFIKEMHLRRKAGEPLDDFNDWQLSVAVFDMWVAGLETTFSTMKWGLLYLALNPDIQEHIHSEIKEILHGRSFKELRMADKHQMAWTAATILEVQRCANMASMNLGHKTFKDTNINGHFIKAGTTIIPQIASVLIDPRFFPNPQKFDPSRFFGDEGKKAAEMVISVQPG